VDLWQGLFFSPISPAVLALFRIAFGAVLVGDALLLVRDAPRLLHPDGVFDLATAKRAPVGRRLGLLVWLPPTVGAVRLVLALHLVAVVAVTLGLLTPLATAVAFVTLTSLHHRDPMVLNSADAVARLLLFWLVFAPAGRVLSLDARLFDLDPDVTVDAWPLRLLQFQVLTIYLRTGWWKMRGPEWRDGTAVWFALSSPELRRHDLPRRLKRPAVYRAMTWGTVAFELGFPVLVWVGPLRYPMLVVAVAFHLAMHALLRIRLFPWVMLAGLTLFLPPDDVAGWFL
jgi:hypothetical protein